MAAGKTAGVVRKVDVLCGVGSVPLHPPPFLGLLHLEVDRLEWDFCEHDSSDLPWRSWIFLVELQYSFGCMHFGGILPTVVLWAVTFPFDFEFQPSTEHFAVQDFFH